MISSSSKIFSKESLKTFTFVSNSDKLSEAQEADQTEAVHMLRQNTAMLNLRVDVCDCDSTPHVLPFAVLQQYMQFTPISGKDFRIYEGFQSVQYYWFDITEPSLKSIYLSTQMHQDSKPGCSQAHLSESGCMFHLGQTPTCTDRELLWPPVLPCAAVWPLVLWTQRAKSVSVMLAEGPVPTPANAPIPDRGNRAPSGTVGSKWLSKTEKKQREKYLRFRRGSPLTLHAHTEHHSNIHDSLCLRSPFGRLQSELLTLICKYLLCETWSMTNCSCEMKLAKGTRVFVLWNQRWQHKIRRYSSEQTPAFWVSSSIHTPPTSDWR